MIVCAEGSSRGVMQLPIGMRMYMAQQTKEPAIKLIDAKADDKHCTKQVKMLIPQMCHVEPKKRPKARKVTDHLAQCLGVVVTPAARMHKVKLQNVLV